MNDRNRGAGAVAEGDRKPGVKRAVGAIWIITALILGCMGLAFWGMSKGWLGNMPDISDLQNPINKFASRIYSADGKMLGTYCYASENRIMVPYDSLPDNLVKALIATEDERFYDHSGIDYRALGRAFVKRMIMGEKSAGGGSTITQQLAKQLYTDVARDEKKRLLQKPFEWYIAVQLEKYYTKEEILTMYLNYFDFLNNAVGIKQAATTYFRKPTIELSLEECATLVGMCKNPSYYNPIRYNERCRERRNVVLQQMLKQNYITQAEYESATQSPLDVSNFHPLSHNEGDAPYFREYLRRIMMAKKPDKGNYASWQKQQFYDDSLSWETNPLYGWCNKNTKKSGEHYNIYTDGLKIYTTLDTRMQKYAEEAVYKHVAQYLQPAFDSQIRGRANGPYMGLSKAQVDRIVMREIKKSERYYTLKSLGMEEEEILKTFDQKVPMTLFSYSKGEYETEMTPRDSILYYKSFLRTAMMAMEPQTGDVKAYVPGLNFKHFQYDNCLGGGRRQVGSTMKPFLYSLAMMNGYTPCDVASTAQQEFAGWRPKGGVGHGMLPFKTALATSNNQASAWLMSKLNPHQLITLLHDLGVSNQDIEPTLSLCLGPCDISVGEMVSAYTAFANQGLRCAPRLVTRIEDADGNVVATFVPRANEVFSPEVAYQMVDMMRGVIEIGTGRSIRSYGITADTAGKTGTTNSNADGWFIGYCPKLVVGAWVGGDDRDIHFMSMAYGQGAKAALPIYGLFMKKVYADKRFGISQSDTFEEPENFEMCPNDLKGLERASSFANHPENSEQGVSEKEVATEGIDEAFQ